MEKINKLLELENYNSALKLLVSQYEQEKSHKKGEYEEKIISLINKPPIMCNFSEEFSEKLSTLFGDNYKKVSYSNGIGVAEFPVVNESLASVWKLEVIDDASFSMKDFNQKVEPYSVLMRLLNLINSKLSSEDGSLRDIFILNWGFKVVLKDHILLGTKLLTKDSRKVEGTSYTFALIAAAISKLFNKSIPKNLIFTGSFTPDGKSKKIQNILKKFDVIKEERPFFDKIVIPAREHLDEEEKDFISNNNQYFLEVNDIEDFVKKVFNEAMDDMCTMSDEKRHKIGKSYIKSSYKGEVNLKIKNVYTDEEEELKKTVELWEFVRNADYYFYPTLDSGFSNKSQSNGKVIVIDGICSNCHLGFLIAHEFRQRDALFALRNGKGQHDAIIFAVPRGGNDVNKLGWYIKDFFK